MDRMKTFFVYFILILTFYFLSNLGIYYIMKSTYVTKEANISVESPKIEITEFKATVTNGYLKGKIFNNTSDLINDKFLKLDFISPNGVNLGTKYIDFNELKSNESTEFESKFNFDNVKSVDVSTINKSDVEDIDSLDFSLDNLKFNKTSLGIVLIAVFIFFGTNIIALI